MLFFEYSATNIIFAQIFQSIQTSIGFILFETKISIDLQFVGIFHPKLQP